MPGGGGGGGGTPNRHRREEEEDTDDRRLFNQLFSAVDNLLLLSGGQSVYSCVSSMFGVGDKVVRAVVAVLKHGVIHRQMMGRRKPTASTYQDPVFMSCADDENCLPFVRDALRGGGLRPDLIPDSDATLAEFLRARLMESSLAETLAVLLVEEDLIRRHYDRNALVNSREMVGFVVGVLHVLDSQDQESLDNFSLIRRLTDSRRSAEDEREAALRERLKEVLENLVSKTLLTSTSHQPPLITRLHLQVDQTRGLEQLEPLMFTRSESSEEKTQDWRQVGLLQLAPGDGGVTINGQRRPDTPEAVSTLTVHMKGRDAKVAHTQDSVSPRVAIIESRYNLTRSCSLGTRPKSRTHQRHFSSAAVAAAAAGNDSSSSDYVTDQEGVEGRKCLNAMGLPSTKRRVKRQNTPKRFPRSEWPNGVNPEVLTEQARERISIESPTGEDLLTSGARPWNTRSVVSARIAGNLEDDSEEALKASQQHDYFSSELKKQKSLLQVPPPLAEQLDQTARSLPEHLNLDYPSGGCAPVKPRQVGRGGHRRSASDTTNLTIETRRFSPQRRQMSIPSIGQVGSNATAIRRSNSYVSATIFENPPSPPSGGWRAPRPTSKHQTLADYIASGQFTQHQAQLDRENAHLILSEAVMQGLNKVYFENKVRISAVLSPNFTTQESYVDKSAGNDIERLTARLRRLPSTSANHQGNGDDAASEHSMSENESVVEVVGAVCASGAGRTPVNINRNDTSAEAIALALLANNEAEHLPKVKVSDVQWIMSYDDIQQDLPFSRDHREEGDLAETSCLQESRLRGTADWAPPRPQLIFEIHEQKKNRESISSQNFRCRGCGVSVAPKYATKFRFCNYYGAFFCTSCHTNAESIIPAKIVHKWNFKEEPVSDYARSVINSHSCQRRIDIQTINPDLVQRVAKLRRAIELKRMASLVFPYILSCKLTAEEENNDSSLRKKAEEYDDLENPSDFTLYELCLVKLGKFSKDLKTTIDAATAHVMSCKLCHMRGHCCESCRSDDILFPFQTSAVAQCPNCRACYHEPCFANISRLKKECSKCQRIRDRKTKNWED